MNLTEYQTEKIIESAYCTNAEMSLNDILKFYSSEVVKNTAAVNQVDISSLEFMGKVVEKSIRHSSGKFFEVIGLSIRNSDKREVGSAGWDQPIIRKKHEITMVG